MKALLIQNPNSTSQTPELFSRIVPILRGVEGLELLSVSTTRPNHAKDMCAQIMQRKLGNAQPVTKLESPDAKTLEDFNPALEQFDPDIIIAVGGDGTVNEIINGLLGEYEAGSDKPNVDVDRLPTLAVIPTGSANVFARALGFPGEPTYAAEVLAEMIAQNKTRLVDLGTWDNNWFCVNAGFGIDADVIAGVERLRNKGFSATPLRYLRVTSRVWRRILDTPPTIDVRATDREGKTFEAQGLPILIASNTNPWTFLGPLPVVTNPRNSFDLGLSLFGIKDLDGLAGAASLMHLFGAGHGGLLERPTEKIVKQRIEMFDDAMDVDLDCHEEQRFQVDGEYAGKLESVHLGAVPEAIKVYAPDEQVDATPVSKVRQLLGFFDIRI
ncbi:diacylglycerol/lipid kinase family protein [Corynebacterium sp. ZY180755]